MSNGVPVVPAFTMDYRKAEAALQTGYRNGAARYRLDDEIEITTPHHCHVAAILSEITSSFDRPVSVLDVGCGTGRYFHCLKNVENLVGMDISQEMLEAAQEPVNSDQVSANEIQLICDNVFFADFPGRSFDFIYSMGMFGHGCPVTVELCNKFHDWLAPGGQLYFDVVDIDGLPWKARWRKKVRRLVYPMLPVPWQSALDSRQKDVPFFGLGQRELEGILRTSRFQQFCVASRVCESPLWHGRHLECRASIPSIVEVQQ